MSLKIKGPVLSEDQIAVINELKELEIFILDKINAIQNHRYLEVNPRWLATGKTDIEKGFIRAEVVAYEKFIDNKGWQGSKEKGAMRLEGKEYIVNDGDVMYFRFNV